MCTIRTFGKIALVLAALLVSVQLAAAHFKLNLNVRIIHVEHTADGLDVYLRLPMPYLVADKLGPEGADGLPTAAPYTTNAQEDGTLVHYLDPAQLESNSLGLGKIAAEGHPITAQNKTLPSNVEAVQVYKRGEEPGFATLKAAKETFAQDLAAPKNPAPYVGDTVVDVHIRYPAGKTVNAYELRSTLDPGLPGQDETANLIIDYGAGGSKIFRANGLLKDGVNVSRSAWAAVLTFVYEGIRHILGGLDHVLFVLCLALGANRLWGLVERVTGFTIGHTITLIAGFFGFVPTGAWFVPAIELGIAVTIVYAAYLVLRSSSTDQKDTWQMFAVTTVIGLLHGLGFSFVLHEILRVDSPNLWQSLIAFNVGVEIGQLAIILAVWPLFQILYRVNQPTWRVARTAVAAICLIISAYWIFERSALLISA
ncbi:MAG: HupE/UreJ family protein [Hyphomicrobiales bacterium]